MGATAQPILVVVVDTEEKFDWDAPSFDRNAINVDHMREIGAFQEICDAFGIRPVYAIDYPIATQDISLAQLAPLLAKGRAVVGAHLHPWVNPPFEEALTRANSYPGNLPPALERAKLAALTEAITRNLGVQPRSYKAGRYGFGPGTADTLTALGYVIDLSFCPGFDFRADGGPDYRRTGAQPGQLGPDRTILELPATAGFTGRLRTAGPHLQAAIQHPLGSVTRLGGILGRLGMLSRIRLSPEGFAFQDTRALTQSLLADGLRIFSFTLHSPSVQPGCTSYVRDHNELQTFLQHIRAYFQFFLTELGGVAMTPDQVWEYVGMAQPESVA
jgi:hypothetical protein